MLALSLLQPWASLIAMGEKTVESRNWRTDRKNLRIAIHASKNLSGSDKNLCMCAPFAEVLRAHGHYSWKTLPFGAVIATAELVHCIPGKMALNLMRDGKLGARYEEEFGNFDGDDRWAWILKDVQVLDRPIPAKGSLGLWQWACDGPEDTAVPPPVQAVSSGLFE